MAGFGAPQLLPDEQRELEAIANFLQDHFDTTFNPPILQFVASKNSTCDGRECSTSTASALIAAYTSVTIVSAPFVSNDAISRVSSTESGISVECDKDVKPEIEIIAVESAIQIIDTSVFATTSPCTQPSNPTARAWRYGGPSQHIANEHLITDMHLDKFGKG